MITDNYIKMCEQAEEIQKLWHDKFVYVKRYGDLCWRGNDYLMIPDACFIITDPWFIPKKEVWLPTLEQLFDMLEGTVLEKLDNFMANLTINVWETLQEHLLNHVMEHNWGKMWNNEKWEEI